jgi:Protein affecting phage T7 exclusion by the F plasmid
VSPLRLLLVLFLTVPLIEIYLLIKVGSVLGVLPTLLLLVLMGVLGAWLLRLQGFSTLKRVRLSLERGEAPAIELIEGLILLLAGALFLTPGFFTDAIGFAALVPKIRRHLAAWLLKRGLVMSATTPIASGAPKDPRTIEGEWQREDE